MILVDAPMPNRCSQCILRWSCEVYNGWLMDGSFSVLKPMENEKCMIKGEHK